MPKRKPVKVDRLSHRVMKAGLALNAAAETLAEAQMALQDAAQQLVRLGQDLEEEAQT